MLMRGSIFQGDGSNAYDVVILGHQEYVTQKEYDNFKQFVGDGGTMIILMGMYFMLKSNMIGIQEMYHLLKVIAGHSTVSLRGEV